MLKEQEEVFKKSLGREFAKYVLGKVTIEIEDVEPKYSPSAVYTNPPTKYKLPNVTILVYNAITNTTFTYHSKDAYMNYFICMHTTEMIAKDILKEYRKYVYALFYKKPNKDSNTMVLQA